MTKAHEVSNSDNVIDSRDVIARLDELESERDSAALDEDAYREMNGGANVFTAENGDEFKPDDWDDEREAEYQSLKALARHGETLIRGTYFTEYAEDLADDIGAIDRKAGWPCNCIDWEKAADELKADYMSVEFDGETYWMRA
jgi:hypothetical protein